MTNQAFRFVPVLEPQDVDHLQLKELYTYWCRRRETGRMPGRASIRSRDITRHAPFLAITELLRSDGMFRILGAGRRASEFWQLGGAPAEAADAGARYKLMRALMRHQAANRLPLTLRSTIGTEPELGFALIALPLSEDGEEVSASLIEVISWHLAG